MPVVQNTNPAQKMQRKARSIQRNLGTRSAAGYMRNRGFSLPEALFNLVYRSAA